MIADFSQLQPLPVGKIQILQSVSFTQNKVFQTYCDTYEVPLVKFTVRNHNRCLEKHL